MPAAFKQCRFRESPVLPFNAFGTMAIAREEFDPNSGSSQFFWLLKVGRSPAGWLIGLSVAGCGSGMLALLVGTVAAAVVAMGSEKSRRSCKRSASQIKIAVFS
jgi:cyclophilin family peptidyl-prolyl cis-trans isomerase